MGSNQTQCWSCGLFYDRVFDRCPKDVLGCGADREPIMDEVLAAEMAVRVALRAVTKARTVAVRTGKTRTFEHAKRLSASLAKAITDVEMLVVTLRNDAAEKQGAA